MIKRFTFVVFTFTLLAGTFMIFPQDQPRKEKGPGFTLNVDVNLVVLHVSVVDEKDNLVKTLRQQDFTVIEDKVEQQISLFKQEDVPVSVAMVIDNSGSMRTKRERVNKAALSFAKTSKPEDEFFLVNFNDQAFIDLDFTKNRQELTDALDNIDARGGTALYDALYLSLEHLKQGNEDKKILLLVSDGEDRDSRYKFESVLEYARESNASIYVLGLFDKEEERTRAQQHAIKNLKELALETGGKPYFPESLDEVEAICKEIAYEIRNQYTLAYRPTNQHKDGTWRSVHIKLNNNQGAKKLIARTKRGYYAPTEG
jgi:Ca-activated chloride channel homolog